MSFPVDYSCLISAVLLVLANACKLGLISEKYHHHHNEFDSNRWKALDADYLADQWTDFRLPNRPLTTMVGFVNAAAWFFLAIPIIQVAWVLSHGGKRHLGFHLTIVVLAVAGCIMEATASLMTVGMDGALDWMANEFNLDDWSNTDDGLGWKTLEMIHLTVTGLVLWIDAMEYVTLSIILVFIFASVMTSKPKLFSKRWAVLGLFIGCLCWLTFIADIMRFVSWRTFMGLSLVGTIMNTFILLPLWLLSLSMMLPTAKVLMNGCDETVELKSDTAEEANALVSDGRPRSDSLDETHEDFAEYYEENEIELASIS